MKSSQDKDTLVDISNKIQKLSVPILESISPEAIQSFKPYYQRYYENKYCTCFNSETENNDILLRFHTNRLVLISIAEGHDIFQQKRVIEKINFCVDGVNMLDITVSGKKKAGAKRLKKQSVLCYIKCEGVDKEYPVYTCMPASLIEVNQLVLKNPQLLVTNYKELGYIGVLYPQCFGPSASAIDKMVSNLNLLSEDEYKNHLVSKTKRNDVEISESETAVIKDI